MSEQIFISYRRDGGDVVAKLISESLKNRGYTVFYDHDSISGGYFDQRIFEAIRKCNDFVLVLPKNSLDRCVNENDWVRQEIAYALAHKKNIIPIMLPDFTFPSNLPEDIKDIARIQAVSFVMEYYEGVMDLIADRIISKVGKKSVPSTPPIRNNENNSTGHKTESTFTAKALNVDFKKIIIGFVAVFALVGIVIGIINAIGTKPSGGNNSNDVNDSSGTNDTNDTYAIKTVEDLKKLIGSADTYHLENDIDLAGVDLTPIEGFEGTLNGNNFSIKNFKISSSESNVGLFAILKGNVSNLKIENATIEVSGRNENIGILCGQLNGVISNISVSGSVKAEKSTKVGGVCGYVSTSDSYTLDAVSNSASVEGLSRVGGCFGEIYNCRGKSNQPQLLVISNLKNVGTVTATEDYAGGVVAFINAENDRIFDDAVTTIIDCENTGDVSGNYYVAGISGSAICDGDSKIDGCTNAATISAKAYAGCIAGSTKYYVIVNCNNNGSSLNASGYYLDAGKKYAYVGGLVGEGVCLENCTNYIDIDYKGGGNFVGGLMGYCRLGDAILNESISSSTAEAYFKNLNNQGNISGASYVGGIMGGTKYYWDNGCTAVTANFESLINTGNIKATNDYSGGIAGYLAGDVGGMSGALHWCFYDSENNASITGAANVGGLFGGFRNGNAEDITVYPGNDVTIDGCSSNGEIIGESNCGEIIGLDEIVR